MPPGRFQRKTTKKEPADVEAVLGSLTEDVPSEPLPEPKSKPREPAKGSLERRLKDMFRDMGAGLMFVDPICGRVVTQQAGDLAEAFERLARENSRIKRWIESMLVGGAWTGVLQASFPIVLTVAAHHGRINPEIAAAMGISVPLRPSKPEPEQPQPEQWGGPPEPVASEPINSDANGKGEMGTEVGRPSIIQ